MKYTMLLSSDYVMIKWQDFMLNQRYVCFIVWIFVIMSWGELFGIHMIKWRCFDYDVCVMMLWRGHDDYGGWWCIFD